MLFFSLSSGAIRDLQSFPTRRSSDLSAAEGAELAEVAAAESAELPATEGAKLSVAAADGPELPAADGPERSEEHTSELQSQFQLVCRLLLEKKKQATGNYRSGLMATK